MYTRRWVLKHKFGMSLSDYDRLLESQGGRCAICDATDSGNKKVKQLVIEHDHATGRVRGLTCQLCNHGLANFRENPEIMLAAIRYLEASNAKSC